MKLKYMYVHQNQTKSAIKIEKLFFEIITNLYVYMYAMCMYHTNCFKQLLSQKMLLHMCVHVHVHVHIYLKGTCINTPY